MTPADYERARRLLMRRDPVLGAVIRRLGACGMAGRQQPHHFTALVRAIVGQQLSTKAAATIYGRLESLFPEKKVTNAHAVALLDDAALRGVGLSSQKLAYLRDLSGRIVDGRLVLEELDALDDEIVIERLTEVKGFGRWTAEMFLMFRLHRPDVLPVGDLGILKATQQIYGLRTKPTPDRLRKIGEAWKPYRSVACWYLWQTLHQPLANPKNERADGPKRKRAKGRRAKS